MDVHAAGEPNHVHWRRAIRGRPVPKPTVEVEPPALEATGRGQRAGVAFTQRARGYAAGEPCHVGGRAAVRGRAISQLSVGVRSPALEAARSGQGAGVKAPRRDRGEAW